MCSVSEEKPDDFGNADICVDANWLRAYAYVMHERKKRESWRFPTGCATRASGIVPSALFTSCQPEQLWKSLSNPICLILPTYRPRCFLSHYLLLHFPQPHLTPLSTPASSTNGSLVRLL